MSKYLSNINYTFYEEQQSDQSDFSKIPLQAKWFHQFGDINRRREQRRIYFQNIFSLSKIFSVFDAKRFSQFDLNPSCDDEATVECRPWFLQSLMKGEMLDRVNHPDKF